MLRIFLTISFLYCLGLYAQIDNNFTGEFLLVDYDVILNDTTDIESDHFALKYQLVTNGTRSYQNLVSHIDTVLYAKDGEAHVFTSEPINKKTYYKYIDGPEVLYTSAVSMKETVFIRDDPKFTYIEGKATKEILGYSCKQLYVSFRGRDYEVYYAPELAGYQDGPWKFWGAPGLILEVKSFDNAVSMQATHVSLDKNYTFVEMPYEWYSSLGESHQSFVRKRAAWRDKVKAMFAAQDPNSEIFIPYRNFEIYTPYYADNHK